MSSKYEWFLENSVKQVRAHVKEQVQIVKLIKGKESKEKKIQWIKDNVFSDDSKKMALEVLQKEGNAATEGLLKIEQSAKEAGNFLNVLQYVKSSMLLQLDLSAVSLGFKEQQLDLLHKMAQSVGCAKVFLSDSVRLAGVGDDVLLLDWALRQGADIKLKAQVLDGVWREGEYHERVEVSYKARGSLLEVCMKNDAKNIYAFLEKRGLLEEANKIKSASEVSPDHKLYDWLQGYTDIVDQRFYRSFRNQVNGTSVWGDLLDAHSDDDKSFVFWCDRVQKLSPIEALTQEQKNYVVDMALGLASRGDPSAFNALYFLSEHKICSKEEPSNGMEFFIDDSLYWVGQVEKIKGFVEGWRDLPSDKKERAVFFKKLCGDGKTLNDLAVPVALLHWMEKTGQLEVWKKSAEFDLNAKWHASIVGGLQWDLEQKNVRIREKFPAGIVQLWQKGALMEELGFSVEQLQEVKGLVIALLSCAPSESVKKGDLLKERQALEQFFVALDAASGKEARSEMRLRL